MDETVNPWGEGWFLINRLVDLIFLVDMILQFFIMYPLEQKTATSQIVYVTQHAAIARHYMAGWFPLDFLTMIPSVIDLWSTLSNYKALQTAVAAGGAVDGAANDSTKNLMMLRVLRAVRMVKLVRLVRASKIYERWQSRISISHAQLMVRAHAGGPGLTKPCALSHPLCRRVAAV